MKREIRNAVIESARLTTEDRDILTAWLHLDYGGIGQGFGGYALALGKGYLKRDDAKESVFCGRFLRGILEVAGVSEWSKLAGQTIRADADGSRVYRIGHIIKDLWLDPAALVQEATAPSPRTEDGGTPESTGGVT